MLIEQHFIYLISSLCRRESNVNYFQSENGWCVWLKNYTKSYKYIYMSIDQKFFGIIFQSIKLHMMGGQKLITEKIVSLLLWCG